MDPIKDSEKNYYNSEKIIDDYRKAFIEANKIPNIKIKKSKVFSFINWNNKNKIG